MWGTSLPKRNTRITAIFTELLERQFSIDSSSRRLKMRSASDYAGQLAMHVNHSTGPSG
ncbi:MAG: hypothetical protein AVDCRST_MAG56-4544 [uncultured Cytophagales bacterium]|uniref:Uncharacterized protein n=1 Tax=uncultured Cytophagales bacterium TaxID=158755 RepID=A0A6J4JXZ5_9SPHI|nr:MAG: hypothetical protein AVDCRST_MAG56-4544 [uncultured Cytophagales bacterium]